MTFDDPTLYARDEEEEFGDTGAYSESLEEDFEEEEEEEESGMPAPESIEPEPVSIPAPPPPKPRPAPSAPSGGGGKPKAKKKASEEETGCEKETREKGSQEAREEKSRQEAGQEKSHEEAREKGQEEARSAIKSAAGRERLPYTNASEPRPNRARFFCPSSELGRSYVGTAAIGCPRSEAARF